MVVMKSSMLAAVSVLSVVLLIGAGLTVLNFDNAEAADTTGQTYNVGLVEGATYSYTPSVNLSGATITLAGTAATWLTVTNGVISGTAPAVSQSGGTATYDLTIKADTTKPTQHAEQYINFTVYDALTGTFTVDNSNTYVGDTPVFTVGSNFSGVTYSLSGAPAGLTINSSTGVISGKITGDGTTGGKSYTAKVTINHLASGQSIQKSLSLKVFSAIAQNNSGVNSNGKDLYVINGTAVTTDSSNADYNKLVCNITSGVTFALKSGSTMPSGLSLNSNGTVTGTSTAMGASTVTAVATHTASGQTCECSLTITSVAKLSFDSVPTGGIVATAA
ncbi:MAG: putative Ig domain-containing protein [Candidatus Methanomethylophilus sp.]|nr:putative Ig domain-containing protein [Methanomethylophilus sp.]